MEIRNNSANNSWKPSPNKNSKEISNTSANTSASGVASVVLNLKKKKVKINSSKVKDVARGLAEIAFSMGETNNPEEYAEAMTQDIMAGLKLAENK